MSWDYSVDDKTCLPAGAEQEGPAHNPLVNSPSTPRTSIAVSPSATWGGVPVVECLAARFPLGCPYPRLSRRAARPYPLPFLAQLVLRLFYHGIATYPRPRALADIKNHKDWFAHQELVKARDVHVKNNPSLGDSAVNNREAARFVSASTPFAGKAFDVRVDGTYAGPPPAH